MEGKRRLHGALVAAAACALAVALAAATLSCGGQGPAAEQATSEAGEDELRLPPGLSREELEGLDLTDLDLGEGGKGGDEDKTSTGGAQEKEEHDSRHTVTLSGASFTVVEVARNGSNKKVISQQEREVPGDYLEIELAIENVGEGLLDLSQYSFRLESPAIEADQYRDYYGSDGRLGRYVSEHVISAVLLDYADLTPVTYKLKKKESLEGVFLFFDLNPQSIEENRVFSEDLAAGKAYLVIHKLRGDGAGEEVRVSLSGLAT